MSKNTVKNIGIVIAAVLFATAIIYSSSKFRDTNCVSVDVTIKDSATIHFIDRNDVLTLIYSVSPKIIGCRMNDIDLNEMETYLQHLALISHFMRCITGLFSINVERNMLVLCIALNINGIVCTIHKLKIFS